MRTGPFWVGRIHALADSLHKEYCRLVRKTNRLPQLIGNATMPIAMDRPAAGLARLAERLLLYQSWANTAAGDEVGLAKWALGQLARASLELGRLRLPEFCDDAAKAEMLLGYLARLSDEEDSPTNENPLNKEAHDVK